MRLAHRLIRAFRIYMSTRADIEIGVFEREVMQGGFIATCFFGLRYSNGSGVRQPGGSAGPWRTRVSPRGIGRGDAVKPSRVLKRSCHTWFTPRLWLRRLVFWSGAVCVGAVAIGFAIGAERANGIHQRMIALSPFFPFVVSPLGLALVALMTRRFFPGSQGSGIPQTIAALRLRELAARNAVLSLRIALGKIFLTLLGLCSGASVGREGPTVQIGAAIMHSLGRLVRFPRREMERGLILAGGQRALPPPSTRRLQESCSPSRR